MEIQIETEKDIEEKDIEEKDIDRNRGRDR